MTFDPVEYLMQILLVQCQGILSTVSMLLQSKRTFVCKIMAYPYILPRFAMSLINLVQRTTTVRQPLRYIYISVIKVAIIKMKWVNVL